MVERFTANKTITIQFIEEDISAFSTCDTCQVTHYNYAGPRNYDNLQTMLREEQRSWELHCQSIHGAHPERHQRTHHHICPNCGDRHDCGLAARRCRRPVSDLCPRCRAAQR